MSAVVEEEIERWTARHTSALVLEIILGKTTVAGASRQLDSHCPADAQQWPEMGVHYPTLPAARRDGEMDHPDLERTVRALAQLRNLAALRARVIGCWVQLYNHRRPHQALGMKTPAQAHASAA